MIAGRSFEPGLWRRKEASGVVGELSPDVSSSSSAMATTVPTENEGTVASELTRSNTGPRVSGKFEASQEITIRQVLHMLCFLILSHTFTTFVFGF